MISSIQKPIKLEKVGSYLGAEVKEVDLTKSIDTNTFRNINEAFVEHEVLVFRKQKMSSKDLLKFGRLFGPLSIHPFSPNSETIPELIIFDNNKDNPPFGTDVWHSDETFRECPPFATCLMALKVPKVGGDTIFSSMTAAYEGLSDRMQNFISGLEAVHDFKPFKKLFSDDEKGRKECQQFELMYPPSTHPVVRVHPETGKKSIFVNHQFTIYIKGMEETESNSLLTILFDQAKIPEYQYRHRWANNTLVIWDNRSVQHYAVHDYWPKRRTMERVTILGDRPIGEGKTVGLRELRLKKSKNNDSNTNKFGGHAPKRQFLKDLKKQK